MGIDHPCKGYSASLAHGGLSKKIGVTRKEKAAQESGTIK